MKVQSLVSLAFLSAAAQACMQFGARITPDGYLVGAIVDNGRTTCELYAKIPQERYFFTCVEGFAAWVSGDLRTLAYANGPNNYRFDITRSGDYITATAFC